MLRVVLAVALAAALLGAAVPVLRDARATRTEHLTARELDRIETAALSLAREEAPGARRTLTVTLPGDSPTTAPLAFVALGDRPAGMAAGDARETRVDDLHRGRTVDSPDSDVFAYRLAGGRTRVRRVGFDVRVALDGEPVASDSRALVLGGGETYHVTLRLVRLRGRPLVVVDVRETG